MFETLLAVTSPRRSNLAGPASALAHGLAFAGLVGAAYWNPGEPDLPDPPAPDMVFRVALTPAGGGGGGRSEGSPKKSEPRRVKPETFPSRVSADPRSPSAEKPGSLVGADTTADGDGKPDGTGGGETGPGPCRECPPGEEGPGTLQIYVRGGRVLAPVLLYRVEPTYPEALRRARIEGTVVIRSIIGKNGTIEEAEAVTATNDLFEAEALRAVRQWRYEAGTSNGQPVRVQLAVVVSFRLH